MKKSTLALIVAAAAAAAAPAASSAGDTLWCMDGTPAPCVCVDPTPDDGVNDCDPND